MYRFTYTNSPFFLFWFPFSTPKTIIWFSVEHRFIMCAHIILPSLLLAEQDNFWLWLAQNIHSNHHLKYLLLSLGEDWSASQDWLCRSSQLVLLCNPKSISSLFISCPQFTGSILTDHKLTSSYYLSSYAFLHQKSTTPAAQGSIFRTHSLLSLEIHSIFLLPSASLLTVGLLDVFCNY